MPSESRKPIDFPKTTKWISREIMEKLAAYALTEDLQMAGDITSDALFGGNDPFVTARVTAKDDGIVCGMEAAETVYRTVDPSLRLAFEKKDGDQVKKGDMLFTVSGKTTSVLKGERTALNFIGLLSGIATRTNRLASSIKGYRTKLLDTRKTLPGLRALEKYAVVKGGGSNHRLGLYDMVLIKENHIRAAGGIDTAVLRARKDIPACLSRSRWRPWSRSARRWPRTRTS